jgi:uncharacterized protein (TIRG00374 family)
MSGDIAQPEDLGGLKLDHPSLAHPALDNSSLDHQELANTGLDHRSLDPVTPGRPKLVRPRLGRAEAAILIAVLLFAAAFIGVALWGGGTQGALTTWAIVRRVPPGLLPVLLELSLVNYTMRGLRWLVFSRALHLGVPPAANLLYYVAGFAMTPTPGKTGEVVRLYLLRRFHGCAYDRTAALMIGDRLLDGLASTLVVALAAPFYAGGGRGAAAAVAAAALMVALCLRPGIVLRLTDAAFARLRRAPRLFVRVRRAVRAMRLLGNPPVLALTLGLGAIGWTSEGVSFFLLLHALDPGAGLGVAACVFIFVFAMLVGAVSFLPGGLGSTEATMIGLLTLQGVPLPTAVIATGVVRITTLWFAVGLGLLALPAAMGGAGRARAPARVVRVA